jgi:hypothetical protein
MSVSTSLGQTQPNPEEFLGLPGGPDKLFEPQDEVEEETFEVLMSLALDGRLSPDESQRFDRMLAQEESAAQQWALWQEMDTMFCAAPYVVPSPGFAVAVGRRLAVQERRRRLWLGVAIGSAVLLLLGSGLLGVVGLVALISTSQSVWLGEFIHSLAYWWSAISGFFVSALRSVDALLATTQARAVILVYVTVAMGMLGLWWSWLRRTTFVEEEQSIVR